MLSSGLLNTGVINRNTIIRRISLYFLKSLMHIHLPHTEIPYHELSGLPFLHPLQVFRQYGFAIPVPKGSVWRGRLWRTTASLWHLQLFRRWCPTKVRQHLLWGIGPKYYAYNVYKWDLDTCGYYDANFVSEDVYFSRSWSSAILCLY